MGNGQTLLFFLDFLVFLVFLPIQRALALAELIVVLESAAELLASTVELACGAFRLARGGAVPPPEPPCTRFFRREYSLYFLSLCGELGGGWGEGAGG